MFFLLLLLLLLHLFPSSAAAVVASRFERLRIPASDFTPSYKFAVGNSSSSCAVAASRRNAYFYRVDEEGDVGVCQVGSADLAEVGNGDIEVMAKGLYYKYYRFKFTCYGVLQYTKFLLRTVIPQFGLALGNWQQSDRESEVILPNGRTCTWADGSSIPPFDYVDEAQNYDVGVTEVDGVVYQCGGANVNTHEAQCFKVDLNRDNPAWEPISDLPFTPGEKVALVADREEERLLAFFLDRCEAGGASAVYSVTEDAWGHVRPGVDKA